MDGLNVAHSWPLNISVGTLGKTEGTEWNWIEPSNGTYNWVPLDNTIAFAQSAGISTFVYTFWSTPAWASSDPTQSCILTPLENVKGCAAPPAHLGDWDSFVKALVTRYGGRIQYFELWNEANLAETWSGSVDQMIALAQRAYDDIKSIDPGAIVLAPSVSRVGVQPYTPGCTSSECWLAEYLQSGGGSYADGFAFHPYACFENDTACSTLGIACPQGQIQVCAGIPMETEIKDIRTILGAYGYSGKPLLATEGGFPSDIISQGLLGNADQQTAYVSRWYIIQASENVTSAVWFSEFRPQNGLLGFGTSQALQEINQGYDRTYQWLVGSTIDGPCALSNGVWQCSLVESGERSAQIVFADSGQPPVTYVPASQYTEAEFLNGTEVPVTGPLNVGMAPLLLETATSSTTSSSSLTYTSTSQSNSGGAGFSPTTGYVLAAAAIGVAALLLGVAIARRRPSKAGLDLR